MSAPCPPLLRRSLALAGLTLLAAAPLSGQTDPMASRTRGRSTAPVTVYEMADFQCPACRQFFETTLPVVDSAYVRTGKVRWVFVNMPLTRIHQNAAAAAEVAMCAARQARFWPMHDLLYRHQAEWAGLADPTPAFRVLADSAGLDRGAFTACLSAHATTAEIDQDAAAARRAGAEATPSFFIEGGLLSGAWPPADFRRVLDSIYLTKTAGAR
jgi:protein-disulfide isomerase